MASRGRTVTPISHRTAILILFFLHTLPSTGVTKPKQSLWNYFLWRNVRFGSASITTLTSNRLVKNDVKTDIRPLKRCPDFMHESLLTPPLSSHRSVSRKFLSGMQINFILLTFIDVWTKWIAYKVSDGQLLSMYERNGSRANEWMLKKVKFISYI